LVAASTAVGPVLGGTLLAALGWEWIFLINVPLGIVAVLLSWSAIPETRKPAQAPFDVAGALWSALAMGAIIMA
ncbi:MFS transporter, partial [Vibrio parahaemolyticus]